MPNPKEVFDNPLEYLDFLQSADFERQQFDWKEVRTDKNSQIESLKEQVRRCISAFANGSREGGLLVLGIADDGTIKGTQHVDQQTINNILQVRLNLINHSTVTRDVDLEDSAGNRLHLLYTPWTESAICETVGNFPKGWIRDGSQNLPLTDRDRERLKRDKRIVDFEMSYCCPYDSDELDEDIVKEFAREFLATRSAQYNDYSIEDVLLNVGAIRKSENDECVFTKAGYLFFTKYPRKYLLGAYVRVLRFEVDVEESGERGVTTLDKDFDGALPSIIRKLRTFFRDSALFRTIIRRSSHGGFIEDPEYPLLAVDEAIVNAVIHRDYGFPEATHCIAYRNGLSVENPGGILQQVPKSFSLADTVLTSVLRNPKIVEWMRFMKDERGEPLVRALREGTRRMRQEMENLGLPAPHYKTDRDTTVTLYNRLEERLKPHAYTHTKNIMPNNPSLASSGQGNRGEMSNSLGERHSQAVEHMSKTNGGLSDLPQNWAWVTLQEICSPPQYGWTTKATTQGTLHLLRTTDITAGNVNWETVPFCQKEPPDKEKYLLKTGDIVISRAGSVGYSYLVKNPQNAVFASYLIRFKPSSIVDENYLMFFLKSPNYWKTISKEKAGIALANVNATKLKRIEIPLPPLAEQHRIVAKLDTLFTQLDTAVDSLKKAQVQLQHYRRSTLKAAFEGELTKEWREGHGKKGRKAIKEVVQLKEVVNLRREKVQPKNNSKNLNFVGLKHIDSGVSILKRWGDASEVKSTKARFYPNDILYGKLRPYLDKVVIAEMEGICSADILVFTANSKIIPRFLVYLLHSCPFRSHAIATSSGITLPRTSWKALGEFTFALPSIAEQERIVSELETHLSIADKVEVTITSELARADRLRQSILKQAFSGKLVPQDPNDEPAGVLLEKIKNEEKQQSKQQKKKTIKTSKTLDNYDYPLLELVGNLERRGDSISDVSAAELPGDNGE